MIALDVNCPSVQRIMYTIRKWVQKHCLNCTSTVALNLAVFDYTSYNIQLGVAVQVSI